MPAKQKFPDPEEGRGFWYFKLNEDDDDEDPSAWQLYTPDEAKKIETAYFKGQKTVTVGAYVVSFPQMVQRRKDDKSKERKVLRQCLHSEGPTTVSEDKEPVKKLQSLLLKRTSTLLSTSSTIVDDFPPKKKPKTTNDQSSLLTLGKVQNEETVLEIISSLPDIENVSLDQAGVRMRGPMRAFLHSLGRKKDEDGSTTCSITLDKPLQSISNSDEFKISKQFKITGKQLKTLAGTASITTVFKMVRRGPYVKGTLTKNEEHEAHSTAVSGMVLPIFDNSYRSRENNGKPFYCVSIPGLNFKYSASDVEHFTTKGKTIDKPAALRKMREIWAHTLHLMSQKNVKWPVLCAIGCGAFKGPFDEVPSLWAAALADQLCGVAYPFDGVILSLPSFGKEDNFSEFQKVLQSVEGSLQTGVILTAKKAMITVASALAENDLPSGMLNPSDVQAVRNGKIGMFWDGGHTALEEILAMQTTLLLQHIGISPEIWSDPSSHRTVIPKVVKGE
eukprot:TRINITY_DN2332_c0_g1_i1.p1 TRINITY_DN2332_c0_g1~~TRINITY_DN2332_c0_g1_i1.p1  ORF type:complete len:510 (+),score=80.23 TRINITY_DN2332_c0_g1_i1:23-1531(+)